MRNIDELFNLLQIGRSETNRILLNVRNLKKKDSVASLRRWFLEKIIQNYNSIKENLYVLDVLKKLSPTENYMDFQQRLSAVEMIKNIDFTNRLPINVVGYLFENRDNPLVDFYAIILASSDIPSSFRRIGCIFLLRNPKNHKIVIDFLTSICDSNCNIIDKYCAISLMKFIYSHNNIVVSEKRNYIPTEDEDIEQYEEQGIIIKGDKREIFYLHQGMLAGLGVKVINGECTPFSCTDRYHVSDDIYRRDQPSLIINDGSHPISKILVSTFQDKEFPIKLIESTINGERRKVQMYDFNDYCCIIGLICDIPNAISRFYDRNISSQLIVRVGLFLIENRIRGAKDVIMSLVSDSELNMDIRILIAHSLKGRNSKICTTEAHDILTNEMKYMTETQKRRVRSLTE